MGSFLEQHQYETDVVNIVIGVIIFTVAVSGNTLTIVAILKFKYLQVKSNILIFSLSVCDIFCVTTRLLKEAMNFTWGWCKTQPESHTWFKMTNFIFFNSSAFHLLMISVERYITIFYGLRSEQLLNKKAYTLMLGFCWIVPAGVNMAVAPWISHWNKEHNTCDYAEVWRKVLFYMNSNMYLVWGHIIFIIYYRIYKATRKQMKQIRSVQIGPEDRTRRIDSKATKTLSMLLAAFYIAWMLHFIIGAVTFFVQIDKSLYTLLNHISMKAALLNSAINVFIYAYNNKDFKRSYKQLLTRSQA